jgi:hypothetical protein
MSEGAKAVDTKAADTRAAGNGKAARQASRGRRLSVALRENLKRRKAQVKGRLAAADAAQAPHDSAGIAADKHAALSIDPRRPAGDE